MTDTLTNASKFLSFVLRHKPEEIGLSLDAEGWADIDALLAAAIRVGRQLDRALIIEVVETSDKKRFALSSDGMRIRASQGHSTASVNLTHETKTPPAQLYHGTATRFLDSIRTKGLLPGSRHHVHLSGDRVTATTVGARHGIPIVLAVDAAAMQHDGHLFFQSANGVWLVASVPPRYLSEN